MKSTRCHIWNQISLINYLFMSLAIKFLVLCWISFTLMQNDNLIESARHYLILEIISCIFVTLYLTLMVLYRQTLCSIKLVHLKVVFHFCESNWFYFLFFSKTIWFALKYRLKIFLVTNITMTALPRPSLSKWSSNDTCIIFFLIILGKWWDYKLRSQGFGYLL